MIYARDRASRTVLAFTVADTHPHANIRMLASCREDHRGVGQRLQYLTSGSLMSTANTRVSCNTAGHEQCCTSFPAELGPITRCHIDWLESCVRYFEGVPPIRADL